LTYGANKIAPECRQQHLNAGIVTPACMQSCSNWIRAISTRNSSPTPGFNEAAELERSLARSKRNRELVYFLGGHHHWRLRDYIIHHSSILLQAAALADAK
jgi:hypothetical protein